MSHPLTLRPAAASAGIRMRLLQALVCSLGPAAGLGLAPPAAAQEAKQSEPEPQPPADPAPSAQPPQDTAQPDSGSSQDFDLDALLNEGEQPPAAAAATAPEPAAPALETIPVAPLRAEAEPPKPPPKKAAGLIEEIVVTAQKRAEVLSKVPIAISAFDQGAMEKVGSASLFDSTSLVPNLQNSVGSLAIRGVGSTTISHAAPTVAIHVDGIYVDDDPRGLESNWDLARVEVLRGPQGTLYGRNATAGVVNMITAKPSQEFEAFGDVSYREGNERLVRFVVNQPVSDTLGLRLAASYVKADGWQKNPVPGESNGGEKDIGFARLSTQWRPVSDLVWDANVEYKREDRVFESFQEDWYVSKPDAQTAILYPSGLPADETPPQGPGAGDFGNFADRNGGIVESYGLRSSLRYDFSEQWSLSWLAGFKNGKADSNYNGLPLVLVDHSLRGNDSEAVFDVQSHELDLNFEGDRSHGVFGLYRFAKESEDDDVLHIWTPTGSEGPENPPELTQALDMARQSFAPNEETSHAVFGQLTYELTETLRLTGGLRYTRDKSRLGAGQTTFCQFGEFRRPDQQPSLACQLLDLSGAFEGVFGPTPLAAAKESWSALSWKAIVDYDITDDLLSYATVSTGYKQGSIAGRDAQGAHTVKPETNTNYELGLRAQFDGRANLNFTAFLMDYVDLQVSTSDTVGGVPQLSFTNVGKARIWGIETEWNWQVTERDRIDGYITYLDAAITYWPNAPDPLRGEAFTFDAAGNRPSAAPESTFRLAYSRIFDLGSWGLLTPSIATNYAADAYAQYTNGPQDLNPAHWRSDLFLRYTSLSERLSIDAFVNNIEDHQTKGSVFGFLTEATATDPGGGIQWAIYTPGRTVGLRLGYRF